MRREKFVKRRIEEELKNYKDTLKEIEDLKAVSKMDAVTCNRLNEAVRIVGAIQSVLVRYEGKWLQLVEQRYHIKHNRLTWDAIASRLEVGRTTAFRMNNVLIEDIRDRLGW